VDRKKALGRGLGALIGENRAALAKAGAAGGEGRLRELELADIQVNRRQPRRTFDEAELAELAASIGALGVVQPVVVRPLDPPQGRVRYELIAGERRLRAAGLAGLETIPALVRLADEAGALEIALAENVAREDLNAIEEAQAFASLVDEFGLTHQRVAELVGRSRAAVTNTLRLLELPDDVRAMIERGELAEGHGRALLGLEDHGRRRSAARLVAGRGMSVRETEALVRRLAQGPAQAEKPVRQPSELDDVVDELFGLLAAPVRIRDGRHGGRIEISYKDQPELERLLALLRRLA
jgi:ParB family transcriptional regulator, chromosome partitioning protein